MTRYFLEVKNITLKCKSKSPQTDLDKAIKDHISGTTQRTYVLKYPGIAIFCNEIKIIGIYHSGGWSEQESGFHSFCIIINATVAQAKLSRREKLIFHQICSKRDSTGL